MNFSKSLSQLLFTIIVLFITPMTYGMQENKGNKHKLDNQNNNDVKNVKKIKHDTQNDEQNTDNIDEQPNNNNQIIQKTYDEVASHDLIKAIQEYQDISYIKSLLKGNSNKLSADPNVTGSFGWKAIHYAATHYNIPLIELLISYKADPNAKDIFNRSPLYCMLQGTIEKKEAIQTLLNHGADITLQNTLQETVLHYAAEKGDLKNVVLFLEHTKNLTVEEKLKKLCENEVLRLQIQTFLCCLRIIQAQTKLKIPKPVTYLIILHIRNILEEFINMHDKHGQTALDKASTNEIKEYIKKFKADNNLK